MGYLSTLESPETVDEDIFSSLKAVVINKENPFTVTPKTLITIHKMLSDLISWLTEFKIPTSVRRFESGGLSCSTCLPHCRAGSQPHIWQSAARKNRLSWDFWTILIRRTGVEIYIYIVKKILLYCIALMTNIGNYDFLYLDCTFLTHFLLNFKPLVAK